MRRINLLRIEIPRWSILCTRVNRTLCIPVGISVERWIIVEISQCCQLETMWKYGPCIDVPRNTFNVLCEKGPLTIEPVAKVYWSNIASDCNLTMHKLWMLFRMFKPEMYWLGSITAILKQVVGKCVADAKVIDLCEFGDSRILEETSKVYKKEKDMKKGMVLQSVHFQYDCVKLVTTFQKRIKT